MSIDSVFYDNNLSSDYRILKLFKKKEPSDKINLIIIDDFSSDGTRGILESINVTDNLKIFFNDKNYGKGYCLQKGIKSSTGEIIIIQDADLEYDPKDIPKLVNLIKDGNADVVYGSRFVGSQEKRVLFYWHSLGNKFLTTLSNMFSNLNLTDVDLIPIISSSATSCVP